jgi:hypothetical protein
MSADNQLALNAGWDADLLRVELRALAAEDFDVDLIGFGEAELAELLASGESEGHADEDAVRETPEVAVSVPGDLWVLGDHRVYCGDATQLQAIEKVMDGGLADMVFCDHPVRSCLRLLGLRSSASSIRAWGRITLPAECSDRPGSPGRREP